MTTSSQIQVRACSIRCKDHPEWGTFGVMEDHGAWFDIHGQSGSRVLHKSEADEFWEIVPPPITPTPRLHELRIMLSAAAFWADNGPDEDHPDPMDEVCDLVRDANELFNELFPEEA